MWSPWPGQVPPMTTLTSPSVYRLFVGIDIAAASATVVAIVDGGETTPPMTIAQTPSGFAQLQHHILALEPTPQASLVILEATGSYWIRLATTLVAAGFAVSVVNPHQAHHFANALLKQATTMRLMPTPSRASPRYSSPLRVLHHLPGVAGVRRVPSVDRNHRPARSVPGT